MNCEKCGREMRPAPARFDGEDTTVGFFPCVCSREAWLNCSCRENGSTYGEHLQHCAKVQPSHGLSCDQCGYVPTETWRENEGGPQEGGQCPRHWDPNSGCDGILHRRVGEG